MGGVGGGEGGFAEAGEGAVGDGGGLGVGVVADEPVGGGVAGLFGLGDEVEAGAFAGIEETVHEDEVVFFGGEKTIGLFGGRGGIEESSESGFADDTADAGIVVGTLTNT